MGGEESKPEVKSTNWIGQEYAQPRIKSSDVRKIKRGDHVVFQRLLYEHHAIATTNEDLGGGFEVIEWDQDPDNKLSAKVQRKWHSKSMELSAIYVVDYSAFYARSPEATVAAAEAHLGESGIVTRGYKFTNNCEDLAIEAKTGRPGSLQVQNMIVAVTYVGGVAATATLTGFLGKMGAKVVDNQIESMNSRPRYYTSDQYGVMPEAKSAYSQNLMNNSSSRFEASVAADTRQVQLPF